MVKLSTAWKVNATVNGWCVQGQRVSQSDILPSSITTAKLEAMGKMLMSKNEGVLRWYIQCKKGMLS